jgi:hypothetical protein
VNNSLFVNFFSQFFLPTLVAHASVNLPPNLTAKDGSAWPPESFGALADNASLWNRYASLSEGISTKQIAVPFQQGLSAFGVEALINATKAVASLPAAGSDANAWATYLEIPGTMEQGWKLISALFALIASWIQSRSRYPFLVLSKRNLPYPLVTMVKKLGATVVPPGELAKPPSTEHPWSKPQMNRLLAFSVKNYSRVVLLDTDTVFVKNADELFGLPLGPNQISSALDHYSGCKTWGLNAGVVMFQPSKTLWDRVAAIVKPRSKGCLTPKWKWLFQEAIICLFGSLHMPAQNRISNETMMIPYIYNARGASCKCDAVPPPWGIKWDDSEVKVINFYAGVKPWEMNKIAWQIQGKVKDGRLKDMQSLESWCYMKNLLRWKEFLDDAVRRVGFDSEDDVFGKIWG